MFGIPGLHDLKQHLLTKMSPRSSSAGDKRDWCNFQMKLRCTDLESALDSVQLPEILTNYIVETTWDFLAGYDHKVFEKVIEDRNLIPLTRLFKFLFDSTQKEIHVVTPNYDRVAEYAADCGGLTHYTGFSYGHLRNQSQRMITVPTGKSPLRVVNIWKVHGSLDWFKDEDGAIIGLPVSNVRPSYLMPVIVTPGIEKYRLTHEEPFLQIKREADNALRNADSYLCVGYGFNDRHLQTTLRGRFNSKEVPMVVLTKQLSDNAKKFLLNSKSNRYLAIEEYGEGSCIYTYDFPDGSILPSRSIWRLDHFLEFVIS